MTDDETPTRPGGAIREDAANWFARMRGPDTTADRPAFEAWLGESPMHRDAYSRVAEVFSLGKGLGSPRHTTTEAVETDTPPRRRHTAAAIYAVLIASLAGAAGWLWVREHTAPRPLIVASRLTTTATGLAYATSVGTIRTWRLADGSRVTLDTDSALQVAFTPALRALRLVRGRARFDVSHEVRPFVVSAGVGTVTAHGTVFDVRIRTGGTVAVRLIRGAIDVALPSTQHTQMSLRQSLTTGEQVVFDAGALPAPRLVRLPVDARWPEATLECDRATLAAIVAEANRYSQTPIVVGDPTVAGLRVSGSFRIDDAQKLVTRLALLFDLTAGRDADGRLTLDRS